MRYKFKSYIGEKGDLEAANKKLIKQKKQFQIGLGILGVGLVGVLIFAFSK